MNRFKFLNFLSHVTSPGPRYLLRLNLLSKIFDELFTANRCSVLEVGAGSGDVAAFIAKERPNWDINIVESSDHAIKPLRSRFFNKEGNVQIFHQKLGEMNKAFLFDFILAFEVLEHIEGDENVLKDLSSRLNNDGYLVISVPAYMSKWQTQDLASGHVRRYEESELKAKLDIAGFEVSKFIDYGFPLTSLMRPIRDVFYRESSRDNNESLETKTDLSGIKYRAFKAKHTLLVSFLITPFYILQYVFRNFRLGDGFIVVARKKT